MSEKQRSKNQDEFIQGNFSIMIATNAFGMGIDKPNIRYVIHYNMPKDLESYYQEAGRAGRDGLASECILLFNKSDIISNKFLIEHGSKLTDHSTEYQKLRQIIAYCETSKCLRKYLLEYFGEHPNFDICNYCSNCLPNKSFNKFAKSNLTSTKLQAKKFSPSLNSDTSIDPNLFSILKAVRMEISLKYQLPAFVILHDKTLIQMCQTPPKTIEEFLLIKGIGKYKAEKYGNNFIVAINSYLNSKKENNKSPLNS